MALRRGPGPVDSPPSPTQGLLSHAHLRGSGLVPSQQVKEILEASTKPAGQRGCRRLHPETSLTGGFQCLRCGASPGT